MDTLLFKNNILLFLMDTQFYIVISSLMTLFMISEILPFINKIKGNGLLEVLVYFLIQFKEKKNDDENKRLLDDKIDDRLLDDDKDNQNVLRLNNVIEKLLEKLQVIEMKLQDNYYNDKSIYIASMDGQQIDIV